MESPCNRCVRRGLPIYLAAYAALPKEAVAQQPLLTGRFGADVMDKSLVESRYVLRGLDPGYVYLRCGNAWRGYLIDMAGYPRYYPDLQVEDMPAAVANESDVVRCERNGKSHTGVEAISIEYPEHIKGPVYIAYSRHKWTKAVRTEIAKNPAAHMQQVMSLDGSAFMHAEIATADNLRGWVLDFDANAVRSANKYLPEDAQVQDRSAKADGLVKAMLASSGNLKVPGLIMALHDPVGITASLNAARNRQVEQVLRIDPETSAAEREDLLIAATLEDLRNTLQKNGGDWPRHEQHLDPTKFNPAKKKLEEHRKLAARVEALSADYVTWMTAPATRAVFQHEFDPQVPASGYDLENIFLVCTLGSGTIVIERQKVWQPWFDKAANDESNILWKAASANDPELIKFLAPGKLDKLFDFSKSGKDIFKETSWYSQMLESAHAGQQRGALRRKYTDATAKISQVLAGQMMWLYGEDQKKFLRTAAQMATLLAGRGDVAVLPRTVAAKASQYVRWIQEAYLGKPTAYKPLRIETSPGRPGSPKRIDASKLADTEARKEVQALQGALMVDVSGNRDKIRAFSDWVATKLEPGQASDAQMQKLMRQLKMEPTDLSLSADLKINPLTSHMREVRTAKLDRAFSHGTAWMQLIAFVYNFNGLMDELKKGKDADADVVLSGYASLGTVVLTTIAAGLEIWAANNLIAREGAKTLLFRGLSATAGGLGIICGATDAYFLWKSANKLSSDGDQDAAKWTRIASGTTGVSALLIGGATIASAFGATGVGIPIAIGVGLIVGMVAMVSAFIAAKKTDTDLEKWIDHCRFGKQLHSSSKVRFKTLEEELLAFRMVIYAVGAVLDVSRVDRVTVRGFYKVRLPFYAGYSTVDVQMTGTLITGHEQVLKTWRFEHGLPGHTGNTNKAAVVVDRAEVNTQNKSFALEGEIAVRAMPAEAWYDDKTGGTWLRVGSGQKDVTGIPFFADVKLLVSYKPDTKTWPEFVVEGKA